MARIPVPCPGGCAVLLLLIGCVALGTRAEAARSRADRAQAHHRRALRLLQDDSIESRRRARAELQQATLLSPDEPRYHLALGRVSFASGFVHEARGSFERALEVDPEFEDARSGLGDVWRYDWLRTADEKSLDRAIEHYSIVARNGANRAERWIRLALLLIEHGNLRAARAASERAFDAAPEDPEALLSLAHTAYLSGNLERAEIGFRAAVPRLPPAVRSLFDDPGPILPPQETRRLGRLDGERRAAALDAFWKGLDPDLTTAVNETRLEFWSRAAHAYFLYYDPKRGAWDVRGQLLLRYGAPRWRDFNPPRGPVRESNFQVWGYPELGMRIWLQDPACDNHYQMPGRPLAFNPVDRPIAMLPFPDSLADHPELLATERAVGVFHRFPPGTAPLDVRAVVSRFTGAAGPHLLAQAQVVGAPGDDLTAEWVVLDSTWSEVARSAQAMTVSACDPSGLRVTDVAADLSPGRYQVALSVRGPRGALSLFRTEASMGAATPGLDLSDLVVTCGPPPRPARGEEPTVRLAPNPEARVRRGGSLSAYFEIYGLGTTADRRSRFEYTATVRSTEKDRRAWLRRLFAPRPAVPEIGASREEESVGALRRQFFSVPVQALPAGRYELEIRVRDLIGGGEGVRSAPFVVG